MNDSIKMVVVIIFCDFFFHGDGSGAWAPGPPTVFCFLFLPPPSQDLRALAPHSPRHQYCSAQVTYPFYAQCDNADLCFSFSFHGTRRERRSLDEPTRVSCVPSRQTGTRGGSTPPQGPRGRQAPRKPTSGGATALAINDRHATLDSEHKQSGSEAHSQGGKGGMRSHPSLA